jgi:hypothetical protein
MTRQRDESEKIRAKLHQKYIIYNGIPGVEYRKIQFPIAMSDLPSARQDCLGFIRPKRCFKVAINIFRAVLALAWKSAECFESPPSR